MQCVDILIYRIVNNFGGKKVWQKPTIAKLTGKKLWRTGLHIEFFSYHELYCSNATSLHVSDCQFAN